MRSYTFAEWAALGMGIFLVVVCTGCGTTTAPTNPEAFVGTTQNPLVAQYTVDPFTTANVWVEFGPDTSYGMETSVIATPSVVPHKVVLLVAGMKANTTYHMRAHVDYPNGASWTDNDRTFKTGALPDPGSVTYTVTRPNPNLSADQSGVELLDLVPNGTNTVRAAVSDLDGNIIWYYPLATPDLFPFPIKPLSNGHMLLNAGSGELREIDLAGTVVRSMTVQDLNDKLKAAGFGLPSIAAFHHDITILDSGHLILLTNATKTYTDLPGYPGDTNVLGDILVDLDEDWNPVWTWSSFDHLDVNRHLMGLPDWTHSNAVLYSQTDGNLMISMRHQSWILKIDYEDGKGTGNILWRLGNEGDFSLNGGDPTQWFYGQHYPHIESQTGSQTMFTVFDNGNLRSDDVGNQCAGVYPDCYSRALLVQLDESNMTAAVEWQDQPGFYSGWGGSVAILENGNIEFDMSAPYRDMPTSSQVQEVTQTATPQTVWEMNIANINAYRAYRIPSLYPGVTWH